MPRPKINNVEVTYDCPTLGEQTVTYDGKVPFGQIWVESESCEHCGHSQSVTLPVKCECGKEHYLTLHSYQGG